MIIKPNQRINQPRENIRGGNGTVVFENFLEKEMFPDHFRVFGEMVIEPGCSIGKHTHTNECEIYYMTEGEAVYDDNGEERYISAGDMTVCFDGEFHAIENRSNKTVRALAIVITK